MIEGYVDFITSLNLMDIVLKEIRAKANQKELPEDIKVEHDIKVGHYIPEDGRVDFTVKAAFRFRERTSRRIIGSVIVTLELRYSYLILIGVNEEILKEFEDTSLMLNAWPYIRFWVQTITQSFGWPPFVLPLMKFIE